MADASARNSGIRTGEVAKRLWSAYKSTAVPRYPDTAFFLRGRMF
eukprot:SAG11_NODE_645_length_7983_cov_5.727596_6_plen_45_part_00